jgi:hypothetical protein
LDLDHGCGELGGQRSAGARRDLAEHGGRASSCRGADREQVESVGQSGLDPGVPPARGPLQQRLGGHEPGRGQRDHDQDREPGGQCREGDRRQQGAHSDPARLSGQHRRHRHTLPETGSLKSLRNAKPQRGARERPYPAAAERRRHAAHRTSELLALAPRQFPQRGGSEQDGNRDQHGVGRKTHPSSIRLRRRIATKPPS